MFDDDFQFVIVHRDGEHGPSIRVGLCDVHAVDLNGRALDGVALIVGHFDGDLFTMGHVADESKGMFLLSYSMSERDIRAGLAGIRHEDVAIGRLADSHVEDELGAGLPPTSKELLSSTLPLERWNSTDSPLVGVPPYFVNPDII